MPTRRNQALDAHWKLMHELMSYLVINCARQLTPQLESLLRELSDTFQQMVRDDTQMLLARSILNRPALRDNFIAAQNARLLAFVHEMVQLASDQTQVKESLEMLWQELGELHESFFGLAPPYVPVQ